MQKARRPLRWFPGIFALILIAGTLISGCNSEGESPRADSLSNAELLPRGTPTADAGAEAIRIVSSAVHAEFPTSLTFAAEAESAHPITKVELRYRIKKVTTASVTATVMPAFTPAERVSATWVWDTRKESLPPGAEIEYQWKIADQGGGVLETPWERFIFEDGRHPWQEIQEGGIRLFWYEGDRSFAEALMRAVQKALEKLEREAGATLQSDARIYIYASTAELHDALIFPQEWTGGLTFADYGIIVIGISPSLQSWGERIMAHEMTHLVIHQLIYGPLAVLPAWLDEGLAMNAEGDLRPDLAAMLADALASDSLFSLRSLSGAFPADYDAAGLAYAQSFSVVKYLLDTYGREKMQSLIYAFKGGATADEALTRVYGFDVEGLEKEWLSSISKARS